jgi:hypothetical protein
MSTEHTVGAVDARELSTEPTLGAGDNGAVRGEARPLRRSRLSVAVGRSGRDARTRGAH